MSRISAFFKFEEHRTDFRTETVGGITTFVTMAYIVIVNPMILSKAMGQNLFPELLFATCISAALATFIMGIGANYPFALAPGMGLNAFFVSLVAGEQVHQDQVLGVVLASGILFTALTLARVREALINAVPDALKHASAAGIGLFIAFIGLKNAGMVEANEQTLVSLGEVRSVSVGMLILGILGIGVLLVRGAKGAILIGVMGVALISMLIGQTPLPTGVFDLPTWPSNLFGKAVLELPAAFDVGLIGFVFAFLFVDLFDTMGTLVGVSEKAGFLDRSGRLPRANRALLADSVGTMAGAVFGTSTVTTYIESASGVSVGARTGFASVVTGILFLVAIFLTPVVQAVPSFATAPALVVVGVLMMGSVTKVKWSDVSDALPAFLTMVAMPLTFSIANGIAMGFVTYPLLKRLGGRGQEVHPLVDVLAVVFIAKYLFMD